MMPPIMLFILILIFPCCHLVLLEEIKEFPEINLNNGKIKGMTMTSFEGNTFFSFRGIPYAQPPVGDLRFKAPLEAQPWSDILDATKEASVCAQVPLMGNETFIGSEDCLYLNIYTPTIEEGADPLPVIFWIHGGAFYAGDGGIEENGPEFLMDQQIILVTLNYRLGPFGFLSSGNHIIPGNFGLKDQVLALKWVRDNIAAFNGDKNRVTLYGYSSGAVCVQAHLFSPMSKGLFHGVVYQSGSMFNECTLRSNPLSVMTVLSSLTKCDKNLDLNKQLECLRAKSAKELAQAINNFPSWGVKIPFAYTPIHENTDNKDGTWLEEPFLPEDPIQMLRERRIVSDVPAITGITKDEGMPFAATVRRMPFMLSTFDENFPIVARLALCLYNLTPEKFDTIKDFYFGERKMDRSQFEGVVEMYGDALFNWGQIRTATNHAAANTKPVYFYLFSFEGRISEIMAFNFTEPLGVGHADDLGYVFRRRVPFPDGEPNVEERNMIRRMGRILANFARTGNPTPDDEDDTLFSENWLPLPRDTKKHTDKFRYFDISEQTRMKQGRPYPHRMNFWQNLRRKKKAKTKTRVPHEVQHNSRDEL